MNNIEKVKEIFLSNDIDDEEYDDNLDKIKEWEGEIIKNENLLSWQEHDITKDIMSKAREEYIEISLKLARDRKTKEAGRMSLWAKQDAMIWILSLSTNEPKMILEQINSDIKKALKQ